VAAPGTARVPAPTRKVSSISAARAAASSFRREQLAGRDQPASLRQAQLVNDLRVL
jgi:hypothetical protein